MGAMLAMFWVPINDQPVLLALRVGDRVTYESARCSTDEGWEEESTSWEHDGDMIIRYCAWRGQDCDGRLDRHTTCQCRVEDLPTLQGSKPIWPAWERVESSQRDYEAEKAGY